MLILIGLLPANFALVSTDCGDATVTAMSLPVLLPEPSVTLTWTV